MSVGSRLLERVLCVFRPAELVSVCPALPCGGGVGTSCLLVCVLVGGWVACVMIAVVDADCYGRYVWWRRVTRQAPFCLCSFAVMVGRAPCPFPMHFATLWDVAWTSSEGGPPLHLLVSKVWVLQHPVVMASPHLQEVAKAVVV